MTGLFDRKGKVIFDFDEVIHHFKPWNTNT